MHPCFHFQMQGFQQDSRPWDARQAHARLGVSCTFARHSRALPCRLGPRQTYLFWKVGNISDAANSYAHKQPHLQFLLPCRDLEMLSPRLRIPSKLC